MNTSDNMYVVLAMLLISVKTSASVYIGHHENNYIQEIAPLEADRVCPGSISGLSFSGSLNQWYDDMRARYSNCTYVNGNLIITWLSDSEINANVGLRFLRDIRYVRGYVLVVGINYHDVPLTNLEIIRGNETFSYDGQEFSLIVLLNNVTSIELPRLKEISKGDVIFKINDANLRVDVTRDWDDIMRGRATTEPGSLRVEGGIIPPQSVELREQCSSLCARRCFWYGGCCHSQCAVGCTGPRTFQCEACKDYDLNGLCVSHCPENYYHNGRRCLPVPRG